MSNITIVVLIVLLSLLTITFLLVALRARRKQVAEKPLDLSAFRTLIDRDDETFLRLKLSRNEFFHQKRHRIRVTWKYVRRIADNSAVAMRKTSLWRQDPNVSVAETVAEIADLAAQIRVQCLVAFAKLAVEFAFPAIQLTPATLAPKYESLRQNLSRLGSLHPQTPMASAI